MTFIGLAVIGFLFGLYCLYAAAYHAWLTAYYIDKARIEVHESWFYVFLALSVLSLGLSFILSGLLIVHKFKRRNNTTTPFKS
jgi:H+/Cl- antiporter ClcA